jgi:hypothetical protein
MDRESKELLVFGYGLGLISCVLGALGWLRHGLDFVSIVFFVCSIIFIGVTSMDRGALKLSYRLWMKAGHWIGEIFTGLILSVVFMLIFVPIGLFFRWTGQDHLQRQIDPAARTYWRKRKAEGSQKERYQQQF